jgi:hypothetical protein
MSAVQAPDGTIVRLGLYLRRTVLSRVLDLRLAEARGLFCWLLMAQKQIDCDSNVACCMIQWWTFLISLGAFRLQCFRVFVNVRLKTAMVGTDQRGTLALNG